MRGIMGRGYFSTGVRWGNWGRMMGEGVVCEPPLQGRGYERRNVRKMDSRLRNNGFEHSMPKRIHIVVWDDSCHS